MFFRAPPQGRLSSFPSQSSPSLARMTALKALEVRGHRHILDFVVFLMPWLQSQAQSHVLIQPPASSPGREGGSALSISSPTETPRPVLGPSSLRAELQGRRENLTRAQDGPPSLGWPRRCERMELSTHRHLLDFAILDALASESSPESCSLARFELHSCPGEMHTAWACHFE